MDKITPTDVLLTLSLLLDGDYFAMRNELHQKKLYDQIHDWYFWKGKIKSQVVTAVSKNYPKFFMDSYEPPLVLYYYGNLSLLSKRYRLSCVGTRNPTIYQRDRSYKMIKEAEEHFQNDLVIISGMAQGIDQTCMKAAMECNAPIVSFMGSGIDNPYPKQNDGIYEYCKSGKGLVLSEYPNEVNAKPKNFLFRNRLLACSSQVLYVGGGKLRSGSAASVKYASELGNEVLALPCNCTDDDLTNSLIKDGATPILNTKDLIYEIETRCQKNVLN